MMNKIICWDFKEQLPVDELCRAVDGMVRVQVYEIETGGDDYAILVSDQLFLHKSWVQKIYNAWEEEQYEG